MADERGWKSRLIEEVRKRPILWPHQTFSQRKLGKYDQMWKEISQLLETDVKRCKRAWTKLRIQFYNEVQKIKIRVDQAKINGLYDPHKKYCSWAFYEQLKFISETPKLHSNFESSDVPAVINRNIDQEQKFQLIEEIRKRPALWDNKNMLDGSVSKRNELWTEIGQVLNVEVNVCKQTWSYLCQQFRYELGFIRKRMAKAKKDGSYIPGKKYYTWVFFDSLIPIYGYRFNLSFEKDSDSEAVVNCDADHKKTDMFDSDSSLAEYYDDIEFMESDNDIEFTENDSSAEQLSPQKNSVEKKVLTTQSEGPNPITDEGTNDKSRMEDTNFKTYTFVISSCVQSSERAASPDNNSVIKIDPIKKEHPELPIKVENDSLTTEVINNLQAVKADKSLDCSENLNLFVIPKEYEYNEAEEFISCQPGASPSSLPDELISSPPDLNDGDYGFLCSFLSQTKTMTQSQKMEFRVHMQKLLADTFVSTVTANILQKQLLLPEDRDPDRKFLISFWPFVKSLPPTQNLQFRKRMAELVFKIFFEVTNQ